MNITAHARRPFNPQAPAAIKGRRRWRGFVIGWIAILGLAAAGYALASNQLTHSSAELHLAGIGGNVETVLIQGL